MTTKHDLEFWCKVKIARDLNLSVDMVKKDNKIKEEETKKLVKLFIRVLNDKEMLEGGRILYNKNRLLRFGINIFFKYFINTFKKYSNNK